MGPGRTTQRFLFLAAIGHQLTYTVVEGGILEGARRQIGGVHPKLDEFIRCHLCVGTWVGAVLAAIYRPNLLADVDGKPVSAVRHLADFAGDAVLIALGTRLWSEALGLLSREAQVKQREIERAPEAEPMELEPVTLPGISIRS